MEKLIFLFAFITHYFINAQGLDGNQLLESAIAYHDPESKWKVFKDKFVITMESPNRPLRKSIIQLDMPNSYFKLEVFQNQNIITSTIENDSCVIQFNGNENFSKSIKKEYRLDCDRAKFYRDYYTYLYGLPMKLRDTGTIIDPEVRIKKIDNITYWVLKVTYDKDVGNDIWYFFFDPKTFALKRYQFFHDESKNDGEYVLLDDEIVIHGIKMPKNRSWYYNSNQKFLAIDRLSIN